MQEELEKWSDDKVATAIMNLFELHSTFLLPNGPVKEFKEFLATQDIPKHAISGLAETMIFEEAGKRFVKMVKHG